MIAGQRASEFVRDGGGGSGCSNRRLASLVSTRWPLHPAVDDRLLYRPSRIDVSGVVRYTSTRRA